MATTKIYTRSGDHGQTSLVTGDRVSKSDLRLEAYGTVDELNSGIGVLVSLVQESKLGLDVQKNIISCLAHIQNQLFNVGSQLSCNDKKISEKLPDIQQSHIDFLEKEMDRMQLILPELKNFILPGGCLASAQAHVVRTVCRRAERVSCQLAEQHEFSHLIIPYLNRLNDYFFVLARFLNSNLKIKDVVWEK